jgi:hypothetical protein
MTIESIINGVTQITVTYSLQYYTYIVPTVRRRRGHTHVRIRGIRCTFAHSSLYFTFCIWFVSTKLVWQ